jgi:hypothetical protein
MLQYPGRAWLLAKLQAESSEGVRPEADRLIHDVFLAKMCSRRDDGRDKRTEEERGRETASGKKGVGMASQTQVARFAQSMSNLPARRNGNPNPVKPKEKKQRRPTRRPESSHPCGLCQLSCWCILGKRKNGGAVVVYCT